MSDTEAVAGESAVDDYFQRANVKTVKGVDTRKPGAWKLLLQVFILPLTVLALIVLVCFQMWTLGNTDQVIAADNAADVEEAVNSVTLLQQLIHNTPQ